MQTSPTISLTPRSRAAILDRLYRRIGALDDESLMNLDALTESADRFAMAEEAPAVAAPDPPLGRRAFLLALLTGGAAVAASGTALILRGENITSAIAPAPVEPPAAAIPALHGEPLAAAPTAALPSPVDQMRTLRQELADARSERLILQAQLDSARDEHGRLAAELEARQNDIAYLQQVIAVYDQMDATGLDAAVDAGLSPVGLAIMTTQASRDMLQTGILQAAGLLATVEVQSPVVANGLIWLEDQVNQLAALLQQLEDTLSGLVEPIAPAAQQVGDFIGQVLDLLPFGAGANIRAGLEAIATLLTHIPELVASINPQIITPLRQWVSPREGEGLVANVVRPISENLVTPAQALVDNTASLQGTFASQLQEPARAALETRAALRQQMQTMRGIS